MIDLILHIPSLILHYWVLDNEFSHFFHEFDNFFVLDLEWVHHFGAIFLCWVDSSLLHALFEVIKVDNFFPFDTVQVFIPQNWFFGCIYSHYSFSSTAVDPSPLPWFYFLLKVAWLESSMISSLSKFLFQLMMYSLRNDERET